MIGLEESIEQCGTCQHFRLSLPVSDPDYLRIGSCLYPEHKSEVPVCNYCDDWT